MKTCRFFVLLFVILSNSIYAQKKNTIEKDLVSSGFVNIKDIDSTIVVDLMYTRADNFTGKVLYTELSEAFLHPTALVIITLPHDFVCTYSQYSLHIEETRLFHRHTALATQ